MRRKFFKFRAFGLLFALALFFCSAPINFAQTDAEDLESLPPEAMREVVPRILTWYFKPRKKPTEIRLAARGVRPEWLPRIKNIRFVLVPDEKLDESGDVFFFNYYEPVKDRYEIGFGYGAPDCAAIGDMWYFRVSKQKVRLWKPKGAGYGSGCAVGGVDSGDGSP